MPNSMTRATGGCARPPTPHPGIGEIIGAGESRRSIRTATLCSPFTVAKRSHTRFNSG